jgi:hypothetical protein
VHGVSSNQHSDRYEHLQAGRAARDPGIIDRAAGAPEPSKADANSTISKCTLAETVSNNPTSFSLTSLLSGQKANKSNWLVLSR